MKGDEVSVEETVREERGRLLEKEDTNDGKYGCEEEEVVGEDWSKVEPLVAGSWRHD